MNQASDPGVVFAGRVFRWSGYYGVLALAPLYFTEKLLGEYLPPPVNHPEYYYSAAGLALVFQFFFIVMGGDPLRYRPLMPCAVLEKLSFGIPALVLVGLGRTSPLLLGAALPDLALGALFFVSYRKTEEAAKSFPSGSAI